MGNVFDVMGEFWAEIANERPTQRQVELLKTQLNREGSVLDVACGTGRHTIALCKAGFDIVGLDISIVLLRVAKKCGASMLVRADMRFLPFTSGAFTASISMDHSFGYLSTEIEDEQSLAEVKRVLKAGGLFVMDLFNREELTVRYKAKDASPKLYDYQSFSLRQERTVSSDGGLLCDHWTIKQRAEGHVRFFDHKVRLYTLTQLEGMLLKTGFKVEVIFGGYEQQLYNVDSPRLIIKASVS